MTKSKQNAERAVVTIEAHGARVNESCGLHITITWNGDVAALARLIWCIANSVTGRADFSSSKKRLQRHRAAKCEAYIRRFGIRMPAKTTHPIVHVVDDDHQHVRPRRGEGGSTEEW